MPASLSCWDLTPLSNTVQLYLTGASILGVEEVASPTFWAGAVGVEIA